MGCLSLFFTSLSQNLNCSAASVFCNMVSLIFILCFSLDCLNLAKDIEWIWISDIVSYHLTPSSLRLVRSEGNNTQPLAEKVWDLHSCHYWGNIPGQSGGEQWSQQQSTWRNEVELDKANQGTWNISRQFHCSLLLTCHSTRAHDSAPCHRTKAAVQKRRKSDKIRERSLWNNVRGDEVFSSTVHPTSVIPLWDQAKI